MNKWERLKNAIKECRDIADRDWKNSSQPMSSYFAGKEDAYRVVLNIMEDIEKSSLSNGSGVD
jgi:hypothetical protein